MLITAHHLVVQSDLEVLDEYSWNCRLLTIFNVCHKAIACSVGSAAATPVVDIAIIKRS
ncbi:hypothetical protein [Nostoc sp.]